MDLRAKLMKTHDTLNIEITGADILNLLSHAATQDDVQRLSRETAACFDKVDQHFKKLETEMNGRFDKVDQRFEKLETEMNGRFEKLETDIDKRFERLETDIDDRFEKFEVKMDKRSEKLEAKMDKMMLTVVSGITFPLVLGLIMFGIHLFIGSA